MQAYKIFALVLDAIIGLILAIAILFADWEWLVADEGLVYFPIVIVAMLGFIAVMIVVTYWAFVKFNPDTMSPSTPRTIYLIGLVIFLIGAVLNIVGVTSGDLTVNILGAALLFIGALVYLLGLSLRKKA